MTKIIKQMHIMLKSFSGPDTLKTTHPCLLSSKNPASYLVLRLRHISEIMFYGGTLAGYGRAALYCTRALQNGSVCTHSGANTGEAFRSQQINCLDVFVHSVTLLASFLPCTSSFVLLWKLTQHFCLQEFNKHCEMTLVQQLVQQHLKF